MVVLISALGMRIVERMMKIMVAAMRGVV